MGPFITTPEIWNCTSALGKPIAFFYNKVQVTSGHSLNTESFISFAPFLRTINRSMCFFIKFDGIL